MYMLIIPIILFVILVVCLPELMVLGLYAFIGYGMCTAMNKKDIGRAIVVIAIFGFLSTIVQHVIPIINKENNNAEFRYDKYKNYITDTVKDKTSFDNEDKKEEENDLWNKVLNKIKGEGE